jgi:protein-disulfide isomerase
MSSAMSKPGREQEITGRGGPSAFPPQGPSFLSGMLAGATLAGVAGLVLLSYMNWQETRQLQKSLDARLAQVDSRLAELSAKAGQAAAPARRGPDPDRVYAVKTDGAPVRGPASAPVTVVEFADFQ